MSKAVTVGKVKLLLSKKLFNPHQDIFFRHLFQCPPLFTKNFGAVGLWPTYLS